MIKTKHLTMLIDNLLYNTTARPSIETIEYTEEEINDYLKEIVVRLKERDELKKELNKLKKPKKPNPCLGMH